MINASLREQSNLFFTFFLKFIKQTFYSISVSWFPGEVIDLNINFVSGTNITHISFSLHHNNTNLFDNNILNNKYNYSKAILFLITQTLVFSIDRLNFYY